MALVPNRRYGLEFDPSHLVRQFIDPIQTAWDFRDRILAVHAKDTELIQPVLQKVGIHARGWWRYRIPGQGLIDWPKFITALLQAGFSGGFAVEHEDDFWDEKLRVRSHQLGVNFPRPARTALSWPLASCGSTCPGDWAELATEYLLFFARRKIRLGQHC